MPHITLIRNEQGRSFKKPPKLAHKIHEARRIEQKATDEIPAVRVRLRHGLCKYIKHNGLRNSPHLETFFRNTKIRHRNGRSCGSCSESPRKVHGRCTEGYGRLRKATEAYGRFRKVIVAGRHRFLFCRRTPNPIPARKTVGSGGLVIAAFTHLRCERGSA